MALSLTEKEARAIGILLMSVNTVGAMALTGLFKIPKKRALELQELGNLSKQEIDLIRSFLPNKT